jgi:hypothetical protein
MSEPRKTSPKSLLRLQMDGEEGDLMTLECRPIAWAAVINGLIAEVLGSDCEVG